MQHVALAFPSPALAPRAARHALAASLRLSLGKKCWLLPAQHPAPHSGCSRDPPSVPQPTLPSGLLSVWVQPREALLQASQHCRNQDAVVRLMFQERQELIIFQAQKKPKTFMAQASNCSNSVPLSKTCSCCSAFTWGKLLCPFSLSGWAKLCQQGMEGGGQQSLPLIPLESAACEPPTTLAVLRDAAFAAGSAPLLGCWGKK